MSEKRESGERGMTEWVCKSGNHRRGNEEARRQQQDLIWKGNSFLARQND